LILSKFFHTYGGLFPKALKRIISILLVFLLLFNTLGFYGLLQGLRYKTAIDLAQRLDNNRYSKEETILLKIPVAVPYQMDSEDYERVDGEFEHQGEFYRLVKQKYQNDTLFMVCIKDHASKRIEQALTDYVKTFTDKPADRQHTGKNFISFIKDFLPTSIKITTTSKGWSYSVTSASSEHYFYDRSLRVFTPPPQS
jgi:hypothetical protein